MINSVCVCPVWWEAGQRACKQTEWVGRRHWSLMLYLSNTWPLPLFTFEQLLDRSWAPWEILTDEHPNLSNPNICKIRQLYYSPDRLSLIISYSILDISYTFTQKSIYQITSSPFLRVSVSSYLSAFIIGCGQYWLFFRKSLLIDFAVFLLWCFP